MRVAIDFNEVDLHVFVRFMSELTGKHFVLDEKVTGKITVYSPTQVTVDQAYRMFLSALEVRRLTVLPKADVLEIIPISELPPERSLYVYKLKHALASDTAAMLTNVVARSLSPTVPQGSRLPFRPPGEFEGPVQVFADKPSNSVIITGTKRDYEKLLSVVQSIDGPRMQVLVEAVIMEVGVNRLRELGNSLQAVGVGKSGDLQGIVGFNRPPEDITQIAQVLTGIFTGGTTTFVDTASVLNTLNVRAFLRFLLTQTDTNILSTPQLVASDNQKAKIVVGENRPFPTGQSQGITGGTLVTIERKDVGVTLEMTPQVLENQMIRMDVKQEITSIAENIPQTIGSGNATVPVGPTTTKRALETITVAHDGQTIVVGGLIRDNVTINDTKIPVLGDIPLLGWLFRSKTTLVEKLNLLVFLTPHIVEEGDVVDVNARKLEELERVQADSIIEGETGVRRATGNILAPRQGRYEDLR
jgi:general secretion pathway protein D